MIMKKMFLLLALVFASGVCLKIHAETDPAITNRTKTDKGILKDGEKIFLERADECLSVIESEAQKLSITGVAMIAFIPGNSALSWSSKMKVVGRLADDDANFLAIAYAKASEMAVTLKNSGDGERKDITGEFGWQGGMIRKVNSGYLLAAFSGGSSSQDADVSRAGLDWLSEFY